MATNTSSKKQAAPDTKAAKTEKTVTGRKNTASSAQEISDATQNSYHHGDLRNALIAAGRAALEELGARELSLRSVAKSIGVSEAAPSRHFGGKDGLLAAIAAQGFRELIERRNAITVSDEQPEEMLRQMMMVYVRFAQQQKGLFNLMVGPRIIQPGTYPELKESVSASFNMFAESVCSCARANGWPDKQLNLIVHSAWAVEHGLATLILGSRAPHQEWPVTLDDMIDFSITMFISRITAGPVMEGRDDRQY